MPQFKIEVAKPLGCCSSGSKVEKPLGSLSSRSRLKSPLVAFSSRLRLKSPLVTTAQIEIEKTFGCHNSSSKVEKPLAYHPHSRLRLKSLLVTSIIKNHFKDHQLSNRSSIYNFHFSSIGKALVLCSKVLGSRAK